MELATVTHPVASVLSLAAAHTRQPAVRGNMDCTPAAFITALKLTGAPLGPELGDGSLGAVEAVRYLALGDATKVLDHEYGLFPAELRPALGKLGMRGAITRAPTDLEAAVDRGAPVVISGDARALGEPGDTYLPHSITLASHDARTATWRISNPALAAPSSISDAQLAAFSMARPHGAEGFPAGTLTYPALIVDAPAPAPTPSAT